MKTKRTDYVLLSISIIAFLVMALSFLMMPLEGVGILPGILFWSGLLIGVSFQIVLAVRRRSFFKSYGVSRKKMQKPRNGLLTFGSNREATIADYCLLGSVIAAVLAFVLTKGSGYMCFVFVATALAAFCLHCIFNGRLYFHVKNQAKIRQVLEQKKANSKDKGEGEK